MTAIAQCTVSEGTLERIRGSFEAFRRRVHAQCPDGLSIDLMERADTSERALCGSDGRVVPIHLNRKKLCPVCCGYVEIVA